MTNSTYMFIPPPPLNNEFLNKFGNVFFSYPRSIIQIFLLPLNWLSIANCFKIYFAFNFFSIYICVCVNIYLYCIYVYIVFYTYITFIFHIISYSICIHLYLIQHHIYSILRHLWSCEGRRLLLITEQPKTTIDNK